ncbi:MAG: hypothetical protein HOP03_16260 [Lysobacter sp.]|nr:hypothetical protein [Lysobacter sp.]
MNERPGAVMGAPVVDYLNVLLTRAPGRAPAASVELGRWKAFASLARQQWDPAPRDQRGVRRIAVVTSGLLHLFFALMLLWVGYVAIGDAPPEAREAGESVQVEYIGTGTPAETGAAPAPGETDAPAAASAGAPSRTAAASPPPTASSSARQENSNDQPPQPAQAVSAQSLVVTETAQPDIDFTLPAPVPRDLSLPQLEIATPELTTEIAKVETFEPRPSVRVLERPTPQSPTPTVPTLRTGIAEIEVRQPLPQVEVRALPQTPVRAPQLREPTLRATPSEIQVRARPAPTAAPTAAASPTPAPSAPANTAAAGRSPSTATASVPAAGGRPQAQGTGRPASVAPSGAGPSPSPRPGTAASPTRSDDWGDSNRNVPGNSTAGRNPGLFNSDGTVRLPGDGGRAGGGLPPGTVIEDFEKIDRMGTWLKRPPFDYTPTRFDRFWVPNRSLLEEWVSRGIKKVAIRIPGTTKRIECTVSLLQAGGGCSLYDPNLQDQEAIARPPPDVPFKPELQEDKDSLKK